MARDLPSILARRPAKADDRLDGLIEPVVLDPATRSTMRLLFSSGASRAGPSNRPEQSQQRSGLRAWYSWPAAARQYEGIFERVIADAVAKGWHRFPGPAAGARS